MKRNMIRLTFGLAAMCVVAIGLESQADARLFGRGGRGSFGGWGGRNHGCHQQSCCAPQPACCEAPVHYGGCYSDCGCDSGCGHGRRGLFRRHGHHGHHGCGCDSGCGGGWGGCGCNGGYVNGGGGVIYDQGPAPAPANNGGPSPAAPEAPEEPQAPQEAPSA